MSLQKSSYKRAGLGLFAERQFNMKSPVGFYMGETIWKTESARTAKPKDVMLDKLTKGSQIYDLAYIDDNCKVRVVRPSPIEDNGRTKHCLYMGMHYKNNACEAFCSNPQINNAAKHNNVMIVEDGTVKAMKRINLGDEIKITLNYS